jgi:hypothetical protein
LDSSPRPVVRPGKVIAPVSPVALVTTTLHDSSRCGLFELLQRRNYNRKSGVFWIMSFFWLRAAALTSLILVGAGKVMACKCGGDSRYGETAWDLAKHRSQSSFIFEGTVERVDLRWSILDAKEGDLIPTYPPSTNLDQGPHTVVNFVVNRIYKGELGSQVQVKTGLGGGDCGAGFVPGLKYLVYLNASDANDFATSMCSPGGWIESESIASDLRFLRRQQPLRIDLIKFKPYSARTQRELTTEKTRREREYERYKQQRAKITGKVCGKILWEQPPRDSYYGTVSFLPTKGYLPREIPYASVNEDGSFCSDPLLPGKYYVRYARALHDAQATSLYYPGVSDYEKATSIEVKAEETHSGVNLKVVQQEVFSVRGFLFAKEFPQSSENIVSVVLFRLNGDPSIDSYSTFVGGIPPLGYFSIQNVLPGRYAVYISGPGAGWLSRKREIVVEKHSKFIWLELIHKKQ